MSNRLTADTVDVSSRLVGSLVSSGVGEASLRLVEFAAYSSTARVFCATTAALPPTIQLLTSRATPPADTPYTVGFFMCENF